MSTGGGLLSSDSLNVLAQSLVYVSQIPAPIFDPRFEPDNNVGIQRQTTCFLPDGKKLASWLRTNPVSQECRPFGSHPQANKPKHPVQLSADSKGQ